MASKVHELQARKAALQTMLPAAQQAIHANAGMTKKDSAPGSLGDSIGDAAAGAVTAALNLATAVMNLASGITNRVAQAFGYKVAGYMQEYRGMGANEIDSEIKSLDSEISAAGIEDFETLEEETGRGEYSSRASGFEHPIYNITAIKTGREEYSSRASGEMTRYYGDLFQKTGRGEEEERQKEEEGKNKELDGGEELEGESSDDESEESLLKKAAKAAAEAAADAAKAAAEAAEVAAKAAVTTAADAAKAAADAAKVVADAVAETVGDFFKGIFGDDKEEGKEGEQQEGGSQPSSNQGQEDDGGAKFNENHKDHESVNAAVKEALQGGSETSVSSPTSLPNANTSQSQQR